MSEKEQILKSNKKHDKPGSVKKNKKDMEEDSDSEAEKKKLNKNPKLNKNSKNNKNNKAIKNKNRRDASDDSESEVEDSIADEEVEKLPKLWKRIPNFGLFLVILSVLISNAMNIIIKEFTEIEPPVLLLYRSIIIFSISMPWAVIKNVPPFPPGMKTKDRFLLLFRGVLGCVNIIATYYSVRFMNLGDQKMLTATRPVFVAISARIFLKEPCGIFEVFSMLLMLVGIVFVVKPPVLFGGDSDDLYDTKALEAGIAVFIATALSANITVILRKLRKEHVASLTAANQIMFIVESFAIVMLCGFPLITPTWPEKVKILVISVFTLFTALLHLLALKLEEANKVAFMANASGILVAFLIQIVYFHKVPAVHSLIGAGLVTTAVIILGIKSLFFKKLRLPSPNSKFENLFLNATNQV